MGIRNSKVTIELAPDVYRELRDEAVAHCGNTRMGTGTAEGALQHHIWHIVMEAHERTTKTPANEVGKR